MNPAAKMICPRCGAEMNLHGKKIVLDGSDSDAATTGEGNLVEFHACPVCGAAASRPA